MKFFKKKPKKCPICHGKGEIYAVPGEMRPAYSMCCYECKGTGLAHQGKEGKRE